MDGGLRFPEGWTVEEDGARVAASLETADFLAAVRLFGRIAEVAEALEHHPDLHLEGYNRVRVVTYSHDVGRLTRRDERLAHALQPLLDEARREAGEG